MTRKNHLKKTIQTTVSLLLVAALSLTGCSSYDYHAFLNELAGTQNASQSASQDPSAPSASAQLDALFGAASDHPGDIQSPEDLSLRDPLAPQPEGGAETVTVLVYMNGSDLETEAGEASSDLFEMIDAGDSENVRILVQTMGTKYWTRRSGIASDRSQIHEVTGDGLVPVKDDLGQLDCTLQSTLTDFLKWGVSAYPADRYILLLWDHGGGPVYGFGYDEFQSYYDALTLDEIQGALESAGTVFDFIGMDCCIMSCLEVTAALYDYCDYCILSEDFESGLGWYYTDWVRALYEDPSVSTPDLAKILIDGMVDANEKDPTQGDRAILTLIDQRYMRRLYLAWLEFAYANEKTLLSANYSQYSEGTGRALPRLFPQSSSHALTQGVSQANSLGADEYTSALAEYYITDLRALAENIPSPQSDTLLEVLDQTICYSAATEDMTGLTGLSVTLPYGDPDFYRDLRSVFLRCGFDEAYVEWLEQFTTAAGADHFFNYEKWWEENGDRILSQLRHYLFDLY
ncbi:MAG: hypothetical protein IKS07_01320 [Lachnospiraceae bacterium]|nr:hypothetical protein [Lachnospiraceae bacterium]